MHQHQQLATDEASPSLDRRSSLLLRRFLVIALYLSFFACLAALWLSGTLLGTPDQILPTWLLQLTTTHRLIVLGAPFVCLITCYGMLRHYTHEIMAVPERYLDERQKMVRDQAHRSAFKIIKLACLLIPALLLVQYIPWFHRTPSTGPVESPTTLFLSFDKPPMTINTFLYQGGKWSAQRLTIRESLVQHLASIRQNLETASSLEIAFACSILVLSLLLLISALPMSVLAWKRQY